MDAGSSSTLTVAFLVPDLTTGDLTTRASRTAAARAPNFDVVLNVLVHPLRRALPQLGWRDVGTAGSGISLHSLVIALGPILAPSTPLNLCDGYCHVSVFQRALRALEDDTSFVFPVSSCHVASFWHLLSTWRMSNPCLAMHPDDWVVLDPITPRLANPHSYIHSISSKHLTKDNKGSLALWSLLIALAGPLGDPLQRMSLAPTSAFMAACNQVCNGFSVSA